ncbi:opsin, ultraviolet-sensitive-like isoform X2 [Macrobrachium nipponense]|uniref:opsin, ultraviolet-sensitive-like isoform X2 n=1 Tax=Macrobrachium nipponense TaxID=159736 RepID=UPI0030C85A01
MESDPSATIPMPWLQKSHGEGEPQELTHLVQHPNELSVFEDKKFPTNNTSCGYSECLGMNVPSDLKPLVSEHWLQYPPPDPVTCVLLGVAMTFMTVVAVVGNLTVIIVYCRCQRLHTPSNIFVMNLALADLMMMGKTPIFIVNSFLQRPLLGYVGCQVYGFVSLLSGLSAIWFLTGISWERYRVMRTSYSTQEMHSRVKVKAAVTIIWLMSTVAAALPLVGWNRYVPEGVLFGCTCDYLSADWNDRSFVMMLLCLAWAFPMSFILYAYSYIALKVKASCNEIRRMNSSSISSATSRTQIESRVVRTVVALVLLWTVSWTPYAVIVLLNVIGKHAIITPMVSTIPSVLCKISACLNPYIYGLCLPSFRRELARALLAGLKDTRNTGNSNKNLPAESTITPDVLPQRRWHSWQRKWFSQCDDSPIQHFMLPSGDIVSGKSYEEAKQKYLGQKYSPKESSSESRNTAKFNYPSVSHRTSMTAEYSLQQPHKESLEYLQLNDWNSKEQQIVHYLHTSSSDHLNHCVKSESNCLSTKLSSCDSANKDLDWFESSTSNLKKADDCFEIQNSSLMKIPDNSFQTAPGGYNHKMERDDKNGIFTI